MTVLNAVLRSVFDLLLLPLRSLPAIVGVALISLLGGVGALLVYKHTSNQPALQAVKARIAASFFEIRLFNDDLVAILRAQWDLLRNNLRYMGLNLVPMLWMIVPFLLVIAQVQFHYGYSGLEPGRPAVLTVALDRPDPGAGAAPAERPELELVVPAGIRLETPGVWSASLAQMAWRLVPEKPGRYELGVELGGERVAKSLVVDSRPTRRSPERLEGTFLNQLLYPAEPPLPNGSPLHAITLSYPEATIDAGWVSAHWLIVFLVLSIVFAFALKKRLGVTL